MSFALFCFLTFALRYTETDVIPCSGQSSKETAVKYVSHLIDTTFIIQYILLSQVMFSVFGLLNVYSSLFSSGSGSSTLPDSRVNLEFSKWSNDGELAKWMNSLITWGIEENCMTMGSFIPLFICSLRESIYQQWRESGLQHSWSPQNLQKHGDRNVSLFNNSEFIVNVCVTFLSANPHCLWFQKL